MDRLTRTFAKRLWVVALAGAVCAGCGEQAGGGDTAGGGTGGAQSTASGPVVTDPTAGSITGGAVGAGADVPVARRTNNDPDALAAYHEAMAAAAAGGGGGGGGASRQERENYRRTEQNLRELSDEQGLAMLQKMRDQARAHAHGESPCDRMWNSFGALTETAGRDPMVGEREFRRTCERMPRQMQACFQDEADQSPAERRYCTRMFGSTDPFGVGERRGMGPPPGTPRPTAQQRRQVAATRRRGR